MSLLVARTELKSEPPVPWETGRVNGRRIHFQLRLGGIDKCPETGPLRVKERPCHGLRRTVAKGRNFESSGRAPKVHQETFRSIRAFALCKFAGWPVYETLGLETFLKLRFFFKGTKQALARSTPSSMALNTVGTENSSSFLAQSVPEALKATTISIVEQMTSQSRWTPRLFLLKKKKVRSHHRNKKGKRK